MTWLKLPNVGDTHDAVIRQCGYHAGKIGRPTVRFQTINGDDLYVPVAEAHRALVKIFGGNATGEPNYDDAIMRKLRFVRGDPASEGTLPSWNIELLDLTNQNGAANMDAHEATSVELAKGRAQKVILDAYESALGEALDIQRRVLKGKAMPKPTAESIQAGAATILIQWERGRCL